MSANYQEGRCSDGKYKCNWIRPRRRFRIDSHPVAGEPLQYKYMQTMGSLLTKKRQNSLVIQNSTASRKNTVVFLSPGTHCSAPKKCLECRGNKNPNNNPI